MSAFGCCSQMNNNIFLHTRTAYLNPALEHGCMAVAVSPPPAGALGANELMRVLSFSQSPWTAGNAFTRLR